MKLLLAMSAATMLFFFACDISDPHVPNWDVDLTVPLMNERLMVSDLADSVNIIIGDGDVLTLTGTGTAETPPFGHVNYTPEIYLDSIPLHSGDSFDLNLPLLDPTGTVSLVYGEFAQGSFGYLFDVDDPAHTNVTLTLPDVRTAAGTPLTITSNANPSWQSVSLVGCSIGTEGSSTILELLHVIYTVTSEQPAGTVVGNAGINLNSQIGFHKFEGYLYNYIRDLVGSISNINIDYPLDLEQAVQLQEASVNIVVTNEIGFGAEFIGDIHATNSRTGEERTVPILDDAGNPFSVEPATPQGPVITEHLFSNGVSQVLQIMPDQIEIINSHLLINGGCNGTPGFVKDTDQLRCEYQVDAPFEFILYAHTFEMAEPVEVQISDQNQSDIMNNILSAEMTLGLINKIPIGGTATFYVGTNNLISIDDPASYSFSKTVTVHSSQYSGPDVDENHQQIVNLALTHDELDVFTNPSVFLLWSFSFEPSDGAVTVHASPADYVEVKCMLSGTYHVEIPE